MGDKRGRRKDLTAKFCVTSNFHGIRDLYEAKQVGLKCFWAAALVAVAGVVIYGCYKILDQYRTYPLATSYVVQVENYRTLPDILICSFTRFNRTYLHSKSIRPELAQYVQTVFGVPTAHKFIRYHNYSEMQFKEYKAELKATLKSLNISFLELIKSASFSCNEYVQYCITPEGTSNCCDTAEFEFTPMGLCYRIKGPVQSGIGYGFGITLVLTTIEPKYVAPAKNSINNDGLSVKLAETDRGITNDMTFLPSGTHAIMGLRATKFEFLNVQPHHSCKEDTDVGYSAARCFDACIFEPIVKICGCSHLFTYQSANKTTKSTRYCTPYDIRFCVVAQKRHMHRKLKECRSRCQQPCVYWEYNPNLSMSYFPSETIQRYTSPEEYAKMRRNIILTVFYQQLEYTVIKHYPLITGSTFISNVGGQLGLWIGGSVLTLAQALLFISRYLTTYSSCNKSANCKAVAARLAVQ